MNDTLVIPASTGKRKKNPRGQGSVGNYVCVQKGTDVKRVKRLVGDALVRQDGYAYCPRSVWKKEVRAKGLVVKVAPEPVAEAKPKKKKIKTDKPRKSKENKV